MPLDRSPYYIRNNPVHPPVLPNKPNWLESLLHWWNVTIPNRDQKTAQEYERTGNSGQTAPAQSGGDYNTRIKASWHGGLRSDGVFPNVRPSTDLRFPWPVGTNTGQPQSPVGRDLPTTGPDVAGGPIYMPRRAPNLQIHSSSDQRRQDFIPIGGGRGEHGLDYGAAPWRVPCTRKSGLSLMAGPGAFGFQQWYSGVGGCLPVSPPNWSAATRGTRGVSGILSRVQGPGRARVPGVFTPTEVR